MAKIKIYTLLKFSVLFLSFLYLSGCGQNFQKSYADNCKKAGLFENNLCECIAIELDQSLDSSQKDMILNGSEKINQATVATSISLLKPTIQAAQVCQNKVSQTNQTQPQIDNPSNKKENNKSNTNTTSTKTISGILYSNYSSDSFEIYYPAEFKIKEIASTNKSIIGITATSPSNAVEFQILSPLFNDKIDITQVNTPTEKEVARETKATTQDGVKGKLIFLTIQANDKSYLRSYQVFESDDGSIRNAIGIKYSSKEEYANFKESYLNFKKSWKRFSD